jgi:4,5-dihydroxyphthalate decarboxylase
MWITRLFENYFDVERAYFKKTKIFPIMHTVVIRREVYETNRWIAQSLMKAFNASKLIACQDLQETAALKTMLPWLIHHVEDVKKELGDDWWSYGVERNKNTLETFLRYHYEQGLSKKILSIADLFAPESLEEFKI